MDIQDQVNVARLVQESTNFGDRAPATEALIDIRVEGTIELSSLEDLSAEFAIEFPNEQQLIQWIGKIETRAPEPAPQMEPRGVLGFLRYDATGQSVVQVRRDGFTYSKLKPYTKWEDVSAKARELWLRYAEVAKPDQIGRLAVRYINHIRPPAGWTRSRDWLSIHATSPSIPGVPTEPDDFHIRMLQPHPTADHLATVTVATVREAEGERALLFDVEVAHEARLAIDDQAMWSVLAELRDYKNDIFFGTITAKTRELLLNVANG